MKDELQELKDKLDFVKKFIEEKCVYDKHLKGYCFDLKKGDVRTLMYKIEKKDE